MNIQLKLHSVLRDYLPREAKGKATLTLPEGATVADLLAELKIERDCLIVINGEETASHEHILQDGDDVQMLMALGGGR